MSTHDKNGRPYAKLSELKVGDKVEVDGNFDCMRKGEIKEIKKYRDGSLIIDCNSKNGHWLEGQKDEGSDSLIGIYKVENV